MASEPHAIIRPQFRLNCTRAQEAQGEWLANLVEGMRPGEGTTVQVGWSILKLLPADGALILCEPDFSGNPFGAFRPSVATTLKVLEAGNSVLARAGCEPSPWRFDEKVVVKRGTFDVRRIVAQRQSSKVGDSGWYIAPVDDRGSEPNPEALEALWAYQLLQIRPEVLAAFALPPGWMAVWNGPTLEALVDENNVAH